MKIFLLEKHVFPISVPYKYYFASKAELMNQYNNYINYSDVECKMFEYEIPDEKLYWLIVKNYIEKTSYLSYENRKEISLDQWCVYLVECSDHSIYTGITIDVKKRLQKHNNGTGAKYTAARRPVKLLRTIPCSSHSEALKLEAKIKKLKRRAKLDLIKSGDLEYAF